MGGISRVFEMSPGKKVGSGSRVNTLNVKR